jgi:hypothetical protein
MSRAQKLLFFLTAWLICLMPFLFWWNTWFGRKLSDQQLNEYLHDTKKPRHIQQALVQVGERITRQDANAQTVVSRLGAAGVRSSGRSAQHRRLGYGAGYLGAGFHEALVEDARRSFAHGSGNAALSLVRFGDASGRPQIVALLQPAQITSPQAGTHRRCGPPRHCHPSRWIDREAGDTAEQIAEIRSPIPGGFVRSLGPGRTSRRSGNCRCRSFNRAGVGGLRALYLVGQPDDIPAILPVRARPAGYFGRRAAAGGRDGEERYGSGSNSSRHRSHLGSAVRIPFELWRCKIGVLRLRHEFAPRISCLGSGRQRRRAVAER